MRIKQWLYMIVDRSFLLIGALLFSQAPLFMQQYTQELSGHADELHHLVENLNIVATQSNKSLHGYIQKFSTNEDPDFARQGYFMQNLVDRRDSLNLSLTALANASMFSKPFIFLRYFNSEIGVSAWSKFEYGLPFTLEGASYAIAGALFGHFIFFLLACLFRLINRMFATAPKGIQNE